MTRSRVAVALVALGLVVVGAAGPVAGSGAPASGGEVVGPTPAGTAGPANGTAPANATDPANATARIVADGVGPYPREPTDPTDGTDPSNRTAPNTVDAAAPSGAAYENRSPANNPFDGVPAVGTDATGDYVLGDFDTDGDPDLLVYDGSTERYYGNRNGTFVRETGPSNPFDGVARAFGTRTRTFVTDVDDDGDADVVWFDYTGGSDGVLRYRENVGGSTYVARNGTDNPFDGIAVSGSERTVDAVLADFDTDGDPDLLAYDGSTERYYENRNGTFVERTGSADPFDGIATAFWTRATTLVCDFDGDGDVDVAWRNGDRSGWGYAENTDGANYADRTGGSHPLENVTAAATDGSLSAVPGDFDQDGLLEVIAVSGGTRTYYDQNGSVGLVGRPGGEDPFDGVDRAFGVYGTTVATDPDGDADVDVVHYRNGSLYYVERTAPVSPATPAFEDVGPFDVTEVAPDGTVAGDVDANNGEDGGTDVGVRYRAADLPDADGDGRPDLALDGTTGELTVADADALDHESAPVLSLNVTADNGVDTATTAVTVTVTDVNEAPEAADDADATDENAAISRAATEGVLDNDADPDPGDVLTVESVAGSAGDVGAGVPGSDGGQFTVRADGAYSFDPDGDFEALGAGEDRSTAVTYRVTDPDGATDRATLTVEVTGVNDAPTGVALSNATVLQSRGIDAPVGSLSATDVDDDAHAFALVAGPGDADNAAFEVAGGVLRAEDAGSLAEGAYSVRVEATDGAGATVAESFTVTVVDDLAPALVGSDPADGATDHPPTDPVVLTFTETVTAGTGSVRVVDDGDGSSTRSLNATGGRVAVSGATVTVDPGSDLEPDEDYHLEVDGSAFDDAAGNDFPGIADATTLDFRTLDTAPRFARAANGTVAVSVREDGSLNLTGPLAVTDSSENDTLTFALPPGPPDATNGTVAGVDGETVAVDGDTNHTLDSAPAYVPAPDFAGTAAVDETFDVRVEDAAGYADAVAVAVDVVPVNDPPSIDLGGDRTVGNDTSRRTVPGFATGFDPGGGSDESDQSVADFRVATVGDPAGVLARVDVVDPDGDDEGTLVYTAADGAEGTATVAVRVVDDGGTARGGNDTSAPELFSIAVDNRAPTVSDYDVANPDGRNVTVSFETTEPLATVEVAVSGVESGSLVRGDFAETCAGGTCSYRATYAGGSDGTYVLALGTAADAAGNDGAAGQSGSVTVDTVPPTADAGPDRTVREGVRVTFDGTGSTDNRGIASYEWDFGDGTPNASGPTPDHVFADRGTYRVTLTVTDAAGLTDADTATVTVETDCPDGIDVPGRRTPVGPTADLDGDGLCMDLDGDGHVCPADRRALLAVVEAHRSGAVDLTDREVDALDYDRNGVLDRRDVRSLLGELRQRGRGDCGAGRDRIR